MITEPRELKQPPAYRVWDPLRRAFSFVDTRPAISPFLDRWAGLFDKQGLPLYERDIIRVHFDWRLGWVSALVIHHPQRPEFAAQATNPDGTLFFIGFYYFADSYMEGNLRQHPNRLKRATEQFPKWSSDPWWLRRNCSFSTIHS